MNHLHEHGHLDAGSDGICLVVRKVEKYLGTDGVALLDVGTDRIAELRNVGAEEVDHFRNVRILGFCESLGLHGSLEGIVEEDHVEWHFAAARERQVENKWTQKFCDS